jgi:hypothetical protein
MGESFADQSEVTSFREGERERGREVWEKVERYRKG